MISGRSLRSVSILASSFLALAVAASGQQTGNFCVRDFRPAAGCNSNDVRIEELTVAAVTEDCASGVPGEAEVVFEVLVSADGSPDRYDVGLFVALDGGSARDGNSCYHDYLNPPLVQNPTYGDQNGDTVDDIFNGPWWNGSNGSLSDGDTCGDIETDTQVIKTLQSVRVACLDSNGDGSIDVSVCTSWDNQRDNNCSGVAQAFPGTNAKCSCPPPIEILGTEPDAELVVQKTPDNQTVLAGGTAVFTITLDSSTFLSNVQLADPLCTTLTGPVGDDGDNILETSEIWTYQCTTTNVLASFTNTATGTATSPNGPVQDSDTADVTVEAPSIDVQKTPNTQAVNVGGTANFTITVDNTGNVDLSNVVVDDPLCTTVISGPTGDDGDSILETTEIWTFTCSTANVQSGFVNTATATATPPTGPDVSDSDDGTVTVNAPSITVEKDPPTQALLVGSDAVFTITVSNSGTSNLFDVQVTDPLCDSLVGPSGDTGSDLVLSVGEVWTYTCTVDDVQADFTNQVDVSGNTCPQQPFQGCIEPTDSDTADVDVQAPAISLTKTPPTQEVVSGGTANFTITVDNTGDVPLSNVVVSDPNCSVPVGPSGDGNNDSILDVTETWTYTCSTANVTQAFTNTASVTATPPVGPDVQASDTADVTVVGPAVTAEKSSVLEVDADGNGYLSPGDTLRYTIVITNSGTSDAHLVVFSDSPDLNTALIVGSVTTSQGVVTVGNTAGDTDVSVAIGTLTDGGGQVTVTFDVTVNNPFPPEVQEVENQGLVSGSDIPDVPTDDPATPTAGDPTSDTVTPEGQEPPVIGIPALDSIGLAGLALALGVLALLALRRRSASRG